MAIDEDTELREGQHWVSPRVLDFVVMEVLGGGRFKVLMSAPVDPVVREVNILHDFGSLDTYNLETEHALWWQE